MTEKDAQTKFINKLNEQNKFVIEGTKLLQNYYKNDFRSLRISEIIDGENIKVDEENILINNPIIKDEPYKEIVDKLFEKCCNLKPFKYQVQTINRLLELEEIQEREFNNKTIVSNIYQLSLPIGSGKSLVFEFLSLFFRRVKQHPIIVSTTGKFLPKHEQMPFDLYPYYYENGAYIKEDENAIQVMNCPDNFQRNTTVIITHQHLLRQLYNYFQNDFKQEILNKTRFGYFDYHKITRDTNPDNYDIMVVASDSDNVERLIEFSYKKPFCRIIVDDYTNMVILRYMKQILSFSTILVSGHGFEKSIEDIPVSYYSMKNIPTKMITLVGNPNEVYEGVFRNNILTGELLGCNSELDVYTFIQDIDETTQRMPVNLTQQKKAFTMAELFKEIRENPTLEKYIKYGFFVKNIALFRDKISELINDIKETEDFPKNKMSNFIKWYSATEDTIFKSLLKIPSQTNNTSNIVNSLIDSKCLICEKTKDKHFGFGIILGCCGSFICSHCIKQATTTNLINSKGELIKTNDYYCCCCRAKNPSVYFNSTRQSATSNVYSYVLAQQYFNIGSLINNYPLDYYFYMLLNDGFKLKKDACQGTPLNLTNDINFGLIKEECFEKNIVPEITKIKNVDILGGQLLTALKNIYKELNIKINEKEQNYIIILNMKQIIQPRLISLFELLKKEKDSPYKNTKLVFIESVSSIIGLQANILGIILWDEDMNESDKFQSLGRLLRCVKIPKDLCFFLMLNKTAYK